MDTPVVSVCCTCFNHERYIAKALQSFINQNTSFKYEIIVHDDASTDNSANIIREFEAKYPDLIHPIYQKENQYSKKVKITKDIIIPRAKGKYIALCEGDDFWCDPEKLQIQFEYMEEHSDCYLTCHSNLIVDESGKHVISVKKLADYDVDIGFELAIRQSPIAHLSTYFVRKELFYSFTSIKELCPVGDLSLCIEAAIKGPIHYSNRMMSCYRKMSVSSWSREMASNHEKREKHLLRMINYFEALKSNYPVYVKRIDAVIDEIELKKRIESERSELYFSGCHNDKVLSLDKLKFYIMAKHERLYAVLRQLFTKLRILKWRVLNIKYKYGDLIK